MLKNKKEREEFLEDDSNWNIICDLSEVGLRIYILNFSDVTSILRFDNKIKITEAPYFKWTTDYFKIKDAEKNVDLNGHCLSYCVDYIAKRELKG